MQITVLIPKGWHDSSENHDTPSGLAQPFYTNLMLRSEQSRRDERIIELCK